ncbi:MAG: hypothetical protein J5661_02910 [Bacteroidaceae bacterium]|nr:hypothetical protein [Bacteroidaceae bacterium]
MHNGKIKVIHMEINGEHYYFGSLKVMCQYFGRDKLGMSYNSLRANVRLTPEKPFHHRRLGYTIREGFLIRQDIPIRSLQMLERMGLVNNELVQAKVEPEKGPAHETPAKRTRKKTDANNVSQLDLFG